MEAKEYQQKYYTANKEKWRAYNNVKIHCGVCNKNITRRKLTAHLATGFHNRNVLLQQQSIGVDFIKPTELS